MANDVVLGIGADASDFKSTLGGLAQDLVSSLGSISPAVAGVIGVIGGIGVAAFSIGTDFEEAMGTIRAGTGATGADLEALGESAKAVFTGVPEDIGKVSATLADLNTNLGLTGTDLEEMTKQFLDLERLPLGFSGNVQTLTRVFGDWSIATEDQSKAMDFLAVTSQTTGVDVDTLANTVVSFGAPLRQLGFDFEESAALIGKWGNEGVNTEAVMSGLKIGLGNLAETTDDVPGAFQDTIDAIKNAGSAGEATGIAMEVFGKRSGPDLAAAIREGRFEVDELIQKIQDSPDSIGKMAEESKTLGQRFGELWNKVSALLEPLGTVLVGALTAIVDLLNDSLNPAVEFLSELWGDSLSTVKPLTDFLSATVVPALQSVGEVWLGLQLLLVDAFIPAVTATWNALKPLVTFIKDQVVSEIQSFFQNVEILLGWLARIPGVSSLVEAAQKRAKEAFSETGVEMTAAEKKAVEHQKTLEATAQTTRRDATPAAEELAAAVRDTGDAHEEAEQKIIRYADAQNDAVEAANRLRDAELAVEDQSRALAEAFAGEAVPAIETGSTAAADAVVDNLQPAMPEALEEWESAQDQKLPSIKSEFEGFTQQVSTIFSDFGKAISDSIFGFFDRGDFNRKLDAQADEVRRSSEEQEQDLRDSLAERGQEWSDYVADFETQMGDLAASHAESVAQMGEDFRIDIEDREIAFDEFVTESTEKFHKFRDDLMKREAEDLKDLREQTQDRIEDFADYEQDSGERIEDIRKKEKRSNEDRRWDFQNNLRKRQRDFDRYKRQIETDIRAIDRSDAEQAAKEEERLRDKLANKKQDLDDWIEDQNVLLDRHAFEQKRRADEAVEEEKERLKERREAHEEFLTEQKERAEEIRQATATKLAEEERDLKDSIANKKTDLDEFKADREAKFEEQRAAAKLKLGEEEQDLRDSFAARKSDYDTFVEDITGPGGKLDTLKTETGAKLAEIDEQHRTFFGDLGGAIKDVFLGPDGIAGSITKVLGENFLGKLFSKLGELATSVLPGVGSAFAKAFGIGGGGSKIPGVPGAGGGAGGAAGAVGGGLMSTVFSGIGALFGGLNFFKSGEIESGTDAIALHTLEMKNILNDSVKPALHFIATEMQFGNIVKAVEDLRDKLVDFVVPPLGGIDQKLAFVQPSLDHFGSAYFSSWGPKFDEIARNTAATELAVRNLEGQVSTQGSQLDDLQTAIERNEGGITTTLNRFVRRR